MIDKWSNIGYLLDGSSKMKNVYNLVQKHRIMEHLSEFNPIIIGTIPIGIDIENSDIDIACEVDDYDYFIKVVSERFSKYNEFKVRRSYDYGRENVNINFYADYFMVELFAETIPVIKQNGYRHMIIEERLLRLGGQPLRDKIIDFKKSGIKTEPAFAALLNLSGNPYAKLLELEKLCDEELAKIIQGAEIDFR